MTKRDASSGDVQRHGVSDRPTQRQIDQKYDDLETQLFEAVADFGLDELQQMLEAAKTIRARRSS